MAKKAESAETKSKKDTAKSEGKKGADKKAAGTKDAKKGGAKKYFKDLRSEIKKVVWPSREKVVNNTGIVIGVMLVCGLLLFAIDSSLSFAINALLNIGG
ncbi:preprotein translocase subunit SecE [Ruminococcus sp. YE71]|uniref:preprotein translocase subunit SecE n=1 Tax=unclassified Ruminococcus TaxID=2608920 RepID=UPI0008892F10|nr:MULTISPECIES: preprotein translocase subunit SecE [unclassified Ruminococcus]SDA15335.1 preprotein translocase subunit SecE [Ruminococcus sp. YE78]SFW22372.1 preprotein translocase subunit SecE [Ruminococcus sp. YE71]